MKECVKEELICEALIQGRLDDPLRAHMKTCPVCSDIAVVTSFLQKEARAARVEARETLPSPDLIWWKAQMLSRPDVAQRATQPIAIFEKVAAAAGALGILGITTWNWHVIRGWLEPLRATLNQMSSLGEASLLNPFLYMGAGFFLLILLVIFTIYVVWAEQ